MEMSLIQLVLSNILDMKSSIIYPFQPPHLYPPMVQLTNALSCHLLNDILGLLDLTWNQPQLFSPFIEECNCVETPCSGECQLNTAKTCTQAQW